MKAKIHKFEQGGHYILLDINSGAVHVIDKMIYDMMDTFDGANDEAVVAALKDAYPEADLREALGELHELMEMGELFAPDIDVPPTFKQKGLIKSICLMVAQDCNLRCKYCFGDGGSYGQERAVMTPEVGKRAIDFLIESCGLRKHCEVDFFGGEPLMNMKTVKAVTEYARQREKETGKKFKLTMTTNGMLLNDENIKWLNDNDFSLVLSLDGRKEVNDAMRPDAGAKRRASSIAAVRSRLCARSSSPASRSSMMGNRPSEKPPRVQPRRRRARQTHLSSCSRRASNARNCA